MATGDPVPDCTGTYTYWGQAAGEAAFKHESADWYISKHADSGNYIVSAYPDATGDYFWSRLPPITGQYDPLGLAAGNVTVADA